MHELGILESVVKTVVARAEESGASRVTGVRLKVGVLEMLTPESLQESFVLATAGTAAEGAKLTVEITPGHEVVVDEIEVETA